MKEIFAQYTALWKKLGPNQKASILVITVISVLAFGGIVFYAQQPSMAQLFGDLVPEDQAAIVKYLDDNRIAYKVEGAAIRVDREKVDSIRAQVVDKQLLKGGDEGYSLLDKASIGLTDKIQDINILRAIEGEVARTLKRMNFVRDAKVKISQAEKSLYKGSDAPAKASVLLSLKPGSSPSPAQIKSIVSYVAGAYGPLKESQVFVTDQNGNRLHVPREANEETSNALLASDRLGFQQSMETYLTQKAQTVLDGAYGVGKTLVRVNVAVKDPPPVTEKRTVDAKDRIKLDMKTERESKNTVGSIAPSGSAGTKEVIDASSAPGKPGESNETITESKKEYYPGSETITRESRVGFSIQKLSIALMIDRSVTLSKPAAEGEAPVENPAVKTAIEQQVALAVGFDEARGDDKVIANIVDGMFKEELPTEEAESAFGTQTILEFARYGAEAIVAIFLLLFLKGMIKKSGKGAATAGGVPGMPEGTTLPPEVLARIQARRSTEALIASDSEGASRVAKKWMAGAKR